MFNSYATFRQCLSFNATSQSDVNIWRLSTFLVILKERSLGSRKARSPLIFSRKMLPAKQVEGFESRYVNISLQGFNDDFFLLPDALLSWNANLRQYFFISWRFENNCRMSFVEKCQWLFSFEVEFKCSSIFLGTSS